MKALILNSGLGSRMKDLTKSHPKCMTEIGENQTILSRQLDLLSKAGIREVVVTTGYFDKVLIDYCDVVKKNLNVVFVNNPKYATTNYIYSIYCAREYLDDDIILMHGDLVFEFDVLRDMIDNKKSCMKVSSTLPLPQKDFKAVVKDGYVKAVGVEFFESAAEAQALYKLNKNDWNIWLDKIVEFCETGRTNCYAEVALNEVAEKCNIEAFDVKDRLCTEIDDAKDLDNVINKLEMISDGKR